MMLTTVDTPRRPEDRFLSAFEVHQGHTLNGNNPQLQGLRREAIRHFAALGFPGLKTEAWKYTPVTRMLQYPYLPTLNPVLPQLDRDALAPFDIPGLDAARIVLVNGCYVPALSDPGGLPEGVVLCGLAQASETHAGLFNAHFGRYADASQEVFTALNTAFTRDGFFLFVPENVRVERPIHLLHLLHTGEDLFLQPRHLMVVAGGAQVRLIESHRSLSTAKTFTNAVTECVVGPGARVEHYHIQDEGQGAARVSTLHTYQQGGSYFATLTATLSGTMVRNNLNFLPDAEHCETHLFGLYLGQDQMHVDTHTLIDHARPNCQSNELYKGILDGRSTGVFNGKVLVRPDAQKTNAYQSSKSVVLTETARMFAKPELEIYADDVKCSHGATTGRLDEEALFYLQSRGLRIHQARALLLQAFARDVIEHVHIEPLRAYLDEVIANRLQ